MNPTTKISKPSLPDRFFVKSIDDYETFPTMKQAIDAANERIQDCLCDGWDEEAVNAIEYGAIMGTAEMFDKRPDETGEFSYICNYQAAPLKDSMSRMGAFTAGSISQSVASWLDVTLLSSTLEIKDPSIKLEIVQTICGLIAAEATQRGIK